MIDETALREGLRKVLAATEADIRARIEEEPAMRQALEARHKAAADAGRTAPGAWLAFRDEAVTQAAVHWLLGCVFVRFLEDNDLVEEAWISGPKRERRDLLNEARDRRVLWYGPDQHGNDADYLLHVFSRTAELPGMAGLFDRAHNPLWSLAPSGPQAMAILQFFQARDESTSELRHDFTDPEWNTRFLGDLYQNLSEFARKRYALCQTPEFVVDFILDRTLTPALDVFGLEQTRLIDPTCGSGHFLLAAFDRLFAKWLEREPNENPRRLAQRALDAVHGVDLNPFAVEIAEFRLLVAALRACSIRRLKDAPDFRLQLAAGDSLLHGRLLGRERAIQRGLLHDPAECFYAAEDEEKLKQIFGHEYEAVVGNPPYINVSDPSLRETYRTRYGSCAGNYQLGAPFTERMFNLAHAGEGEPSGFVGVIVSNAFMKRSFGRTLIEDYIPNWDITHVIDSSGVYLPGHGTATLMLLGRKQKPTTDLVRAVRGIQGEPVIPEDPSTAPVWTAVKESIDRPGATSKWVSVSDVLRDSFHHHPWSIGGGGAAELKSLIDQSCQTRLSELVSSVGFYQDTHADEAFVQPADFVRRHNLDSDFRPMVRGDGIRNWVVTSTEQICFPFDDDLVLKSAIPNDAKWGWFQALRTSLWARVTFSGETYKRAGRRWFDYHQFPKDRAKAPLFLAFGEIATHNHFVAFTGGTVFSRSAPVITLRDAAAAREHIGLLGILNSSTVCFWLRQMCHNKGTGGMGRGLSNEPWEQRYEFDSTKLRQLPIPENRPLLLAMEVDAASARYCSALPEQVLQKSREVARLGQARATVTPCLARMIALQEELDWQVYHLYGLLEEDLSIPPDELPPLKLGERPFEIVMARQMAAGELETAWFERHGSTPITEVPGRWPERYRLTVERRLEVIATNRDIALIEKPEYKRRWNLPKWADLEQKALENWLLDRMESAVLWTDPELRSCSRLADLLRRDAEFTQVAQLAEGRSDYDIAALVMRLALKQAVPFLPVLRYKPSGLEKRREWQKTWELQGREDAGENVNIEVPPKYSSADFQDATWWSLRGSLDVPKERFILYSSLEGASDTSPVIGWAGWDDLQQAQALTTYYQHVKADEAWALERLKPALAGLLELIPRIKQWHNDPDPATGDRMGDSFATFLEAECQEWGITVESLKDWTPPVGRTSRSASSRKSAANARAKRTGSPTAPPPESIEDKVI